MSLEKKVKVFCAKHGTSYAMQPLRFNGERAVIATDNREQHIQLHAAAARLKNVRVDDSTCGLGGAWTGYIYIQDAVEAARIKAAAEAEYLRNQAWCRVYHDCLVSGMDHAQASRMAESMYPTPQVT